MVKKIFLAFIVATLLVVPSAGAEGIYQLVASGTVASASIAVTLTNGSADVDLSSATVPRNYKGNLLKIWDVNNVMIQGFVYTDGAGTVQNIVSAKGGATRNWSSQGVGFDDTTNCRYEIWHVNNAVVVASGTVAVGNGKIDLTATNAFAEFGVDLTTPGYQDGKHMLALYNTTGGYAAVGWISATAPGGETLGDQLITSWTNTGYETWTLSGVDVTEANNVVGAGDATSNTFAMTVGKIYKSEQTYTNLSGNGPSYYLADTLKTYGSGGPNAIYHTYTSGTKRVSLYNASGSFGNWRWQNYTVKELTDCATTGALLLSTKGGSRGYLYKHASFNPNAKFTYKILYVGD